MNPIHYLRDQYIFALPDVKYFATERGVVIEDTNKHIVIHGKSSYRLISWLFLKLNGMQSVQHFLPKEENLTNTILEVISLLIQAGFAKPILERRNDVTLSFFLPHVIAGSSQLLCNIQQQAFICIGDAFAVSPVLQSLSVFDVQHVQTYPIHRLLDIKRDDALILVALDNIDKTLTSDSQLLELTKQIDGIVFATKQYVYVIHDQITPAQLSRLAIDFTPITHRPSPTATAMGANFLTFAVLTVKVCAEKTAYCVKINQHTLGYDYYE